ncbi:Transporter, LysE family [Granulibacter bethesdensis]|uniref:Transporter, LysE family n=1 Tax=Granulibacter bethesdensis TaxID=364410 RepID=A0AAC9KAV0_9PROT|nr:LysE family translocator [Granulibacter bethesdensis]APH54987.1 Transporter, LysE family [Granulibacter bethesdensis]APH62573.1 Transporter, LysE family [Granulibacter bethesdensis]
MDAFSAIMRFSAAAALLTVTPGLDTALVLRTGTVEGPRQAVLAGAGVSVGVLSWGVITALGLGALLAASEYAYRVVQIAGALYLAWLGVNMLRRVFFGGGLPVVLPVEQERQVANPNWFLRGMMTNLLNPKVGVFYVSFLPQFLPPELPAVSFGALLSGLHACMGLVFFSAVAVATIPLQRLLTHPATSRVLDGITGTVMIGFAARLIMEKRSL